MWWSSEPSLEGIDADRSFLAALACAVLLIMMPGCRDPWRVDDEDEDGSEMPPSRQREEFPELIFIFCTTITT